MKRLPTLRRSLLIAIVLAASSLAWRPLPAQAENAEAAGKPSAQQGTAKERVSHLHAVLLNGGATKRSNYQSHLLHLQQLLDLLLEIGVPRERITVFNSDGPDQGEDVALIQGSPEVDDFWRLHGTRAGSLLRTPIDYESSTFDRVKPRAATQAEITDWFETEGPKIPAGDTLLLYVTDHGEKNPTDIRDNTISLWESDEEGNKERLSVSELRPLLAGLDPGVQTVALMSQCFSGSFAGLMDLTGDDALPDGRYCGYYSATAERKAYGCYPRNMGLLNVGHSFRFLHALAGVGHVRAAHEDVLVTDATPDVPLRTTDVFVEELLQRAAEDNDQELDEFADDLLTQAWKDEAAWEPQVRLLDRIGEAFGCFSPRSLKELQEQTGTLSDIAEQLGNVSKAWKSSLLAANRGNFDRFLSSSTKWTERLAAIGAALAPEKAAAPAIPPAADKEDKADKADDADEAPEDAEDADPSAAPEKRSAFDSDQERRRATIDLLSDLTDYAKIDRASSRTIAKLHDNSESAGAISYRMEVRLAVVLRMRAVLLQIAGRQYLSTKATSDERKAYAALADCEDLSLPPAPNRLPPLETPKAFPSYDDDVEEATAALPAWMGIRFRNLDKAVREKGNHSDGAARVLHVYPDSPAQEAGLAAGDIILGPPGQPFRESDQVRAWTMLSTIGTAAKLDTLRSGELRTVVLKPDPYPLKWPEMPGPPAEGDPAPPLLLTSYRGEEELPTEGARLLFFWATWCGPCKAAVPELLQLQKELHLPVIAITDEASETLDAFFEHHKDPFPTAIAVDPLRQAFIAYGVSGTPSFVYIDEQDTVRHQSSGYREGELRAALEDARPPDRAADD